jgi:molybdate transport system permease protein
MTRGRAFDAVLALGCGLAVAFLAVPIIALVVQLPPSEVIDLLGRPEVQDALLVTLRTNVVADLLILLIGTPAAYLLATRSFRGRQVVITLVELPLVLPPAVAGVALLAAFGRGGLFGDALAGAGIVLPFTEWAVVLAVAFVAGPLYLRQAIAAFAAVDPALPEAARTLGASPARAFARVSLPLAAGGLAAGWVVACARGIGEFGATVIFAGSVRGSTQTLTLAIYDQLDADFDVALALGVLLVVLSAAVLLSSKALAAWRSSSSTSASPSATTISLSR